MRNASRWAVLFMVTLLVAAGFRAFLGAQTPQERTPILQKPDEIALRCPALGVGVWQATLQDRVRGVQVAELKLYPGKTTVAQARATGGVAPYTYGFVVDPARPCNHQGTCFGVPCATTIDPQTGVITIQTPVDPTMPGTVCWLTVSVADGCRRRQMAQTTVRTTYYAAEQ
jgi:hypothetical protein